MSVPALDAVNELIRPQTMQLDIGRETHTVKAPCLLAQLQAALEQGSESAGASGTAGSRPPAALNALDLWLQIQQTTFYVAARLGVDRRDRVEQSQIPHVGRLLRTVTATAHGRGLTVVNRIESLARDWKDQILGQFSGERHERGLRGYACPTCCATTVLEQHEDGIYRVPAVVLITRDYLAEQWMTCLACGFNEPMADHVAAQLAADVAVTCGESRLTS